MPSGIPITQESESSSTGTIWSTGLILIRQPLRLLAISSASMRAVGITSPAPHSMMVTDFPNDDY